MNIVKNELAAKNRKIASITAERDNYFNILTQKDYALSQKDYALSQKDRIIAQYEQKYGALNL